MAPASTPMGPRSSSLQGGHSGATGSVNSGTYVKSRKNSVFQIVDPAKSASGPPQRPPRPPSLVLDEHMLANYDGNPQDMAAYIKQQSLEEERALRVDLIGRLGASLGDQVLQSVDTRAIELIDQPLDTPALAQMPSTDLSRAASAASAAAPVKRGLFGRKPKKKKNNSVPETSLEKIAEEAKFKQEVYGVALSKLPPGASCVSIIGGQQHVVPIWAFSLVEEMYRRGLQQPGLFRVTGFYGRVRSLVELFGRAPHYGDQVDLSNEPIEIIATLFRRFLEDMPEPIFDPRLYTLFQNCCIANELGLQTRVVAAQTILRLLPRPNFSLFVYLIAFLCQLTQFAENGLSDKDMAILLGPALLAPRIGNSLEKVPSAQLRSAEASLQWILQHWPAICGASVIAEPSGLQAPAMVQQPSPHESLFAEYYRDNAEALTQSQTGIAFSTPSQEVLAASRRDLGSPALESQPSLPTVTAAQFPLPAAASKRSRSSSGSKSSSSKQPVSSPTTSTTPPDAVPSHPGWQEGSEGKRGARDPSSAGNSFVSAADHASSGGQSNGLPAAIPYQNERGFSAPQQLDAPAAAHSQANITDNTLTLSPFATNPPAPYSAAESTRASFASKGTGHSRSSMDAHSVPPEGAWMREQGPKRRQDSLHSKAPGSPPSPKSPTSPRFHAKLDDTHARLQRHLEESLAAHERLKADNASLLQRIVDQEQELGKQREAHLKHVSDCSQDVEELRMALTKAQRRRFDEEDSLVQEYKALAAKAEQQATLAKEQSLAELQRLLAVVDRLTKEKDSANRRLKVIKRALSSESLMLSSRNSVSYHAHAQDDPKSPPL